MARRLRDVVVCALVIAALPVALCDAAAPSKGDVPAKRPDWALRFSAKFTTDFDKRFAVDSQWQVHRGQWAMENGMLQGQGPGAVLLCNKAFRPPLRVQYDCRSDDPCDLSLVLRSHLEAKASGGYFVGFGSFHNTYSKIDATPGGELVRNPKAVIQSGRLHRVVVELTEKTIACYVDGRRAMAAPARSGLGVRYVGFYVWTRGSFDNVQVWSPNEPAEGDTLVKRIVRQLRTFNDEPVGSPPAQCRVTAPDRCGVRIADLPTWIYDAEKTRGLPSYGLFYMAIDTNTRLGRSTLSTDRGVTFTADSLRPGHGPGKLYQGELMVRLEVAEPGKPGDKAPLRWRTVQHDDGTKESHWGTSCTPLQVLRKTLVLDADPSTLRAARITYLMAGQPFHLRAKRHFAAPKPGVHWVDVLVRLNDKVVARGSPVKLVTQGWRQVSVDPRLLKRGENRVELTWAEVQGGERVVPDACVEMVDENDAPGQCARATFDLPAMSAGLVQFDVMADAFAGEALRVWLGPDVGLVVDSHGAFAYQAKGKRHRLLDTVRFSNVPGQGGPWRLHTRRWYTLRIDFDVPNHVANIAIVNLYTTRRHPAKDAVAKFLVLGRALPMPLGGVRSLRFETGGTGKIHIDNLFAISRTPDLADDAAWQVPARAIVTDWYPLRKDPFDLHAYSLRHIHQRMPTQRAAPGPEYVRLRRGEHPQFLRCADTYNRVLVAHAFLAERLQELRRARYQLGQFAGDPGVAFDKPLGDLARAVDAIEGDLNVLYRLYADCYMDRLNEKRLAADFPVPTVRLQRAVRDAQDRVRALLDRFRRDGARVGPVLDAPIGPGRIDRAPTEYARGAFRRNGRPCLLAGQRGELVYPGQDELLGVGYCSSVFPLYPAVVYKAKAPALLEHDRIRYSARRGLRGRVRPGRPVGSSVGYWIGLHRCHSVAPKWWLDKHRDDPDIYLKGPDGEHANTRDHLSLNFWHPEVQRLHTELCRTATREFVSHYDGRVWFGNLGAEGFLCGETEGRRFETGYNTSAVRAFREYLKATYKTIDALNATWRTQYRDFSAVQPPPSTQRVPRIKPTGLTYEWARFRQKSWHDWMKRSRDAVREVMPGLPFACYLSIGSFFGPSAVSGFDPVEMFETFDIVTDHGRLFLTDMVPNSRMLDSLRKAYGTCTGNLEWGGYPFVDIFDEQDLKDGAMRLAYRMIHWGDSVLDYWYGIHAGWAESCNWTDPRLGHTLLRYSSTFVPLSIARADAAAAVFYGCPTVTPDVAILESQASFYNAYPPHIVRATMQSVATMLERKGHSYGFLFEKLLLTGRQKLAGHKVVVLPHGVTLQKGLTEQLTAWVRGGGVLIALGPPGLYDPYGRPDGRLMTDAFGKNEWTRDPKRRHWRVRFAKAPTYRCPDDGRSFLAEGRLGKGAVYVAPAFPAALGEPVYTLVRTHAPRRFYAADNKVELVMRQGTGCRYLSIFNATRQTVDERIVLGQARAVLNDLRTGLPLATRRVKDGLAFGVRLAPVEGMIVRIADK